MNESEPSWKAAEKLVAAIEKSLAPDGVVEHDVHLPVLGQKRFRQCDVVLRVGKKPRDQVFIIEVQRRGSKPDINTFGGWLRKMEEVGASGLICVSEAGYPDSIIQDVAQRVGPKVKLITLDPNGDSFEGLRIHIVPEFVRSTYKIRDVDIVTFEFLDPIPEELRTEEGVRIKYLKANAFSNFGPGTQTFSVTDIVIQGVNARDPYREIPQLKPGIKADVTYTMIASEEVPLWFHTDQGTFRLKTLTVRASVHRIDISEPMIYSKWSYTQEFHGSTLAWAASSSFEVEGSTMKMTLIFVPDDKGFLHPSLELETNPR